MRKEVVSAGKLKSLQCFLDGLKWDGKHRLETWMEDYLCAESPPIDHGNNWLVAAVKRTFEPGCDVGAPLMVLRGRQGIGKTSALKLLATFGDVGMEQIYCTDLIGFLQIHESSAVAAMQDNLIVILDRLEKITKKNTDDFREWLCLGTDTVLRKYENVPEIYPRQFVFAATVNSDKILRWATSKNSEVIVVNVKDQIDLEKIKRDKLQLWAEAVYLYNNS